MKWIEFENKTNFEKLVFDLTSKSLDLISKSAFKDETFTAFAFNCVSFPSISLSFDTNTDNKQKGYYPPDWTNECMEVDIPEIGSLWNNEFNRIEEDIENLMDNTDDDDLIDEFESGYLDSLRKVLAQLENNNAFGKIKTSSEFWTLVTQIDADTDEEETALNEVREKYKL